MRKKLNIVTVNTLQVGDTFAWQGTTGNRFKVTRIEGVTIYYTNGGREYNCNYDEGKCVKF